MAWETPKTDWAAGDNIGSSDFNRIEANAAYLKTQTDITAATTITLTLSGTNITTVTHPTCTIQRVGSLIIMAMSTFQCTITGATALTITGTMPTGFHTASSDVTIFFALYMTIDAVSKVRNGLMIKNGSGSTFSVRLEWFDADADGYDGTFPATSAVVRAQYNPCPLIMVAA